MLESRAHASKIATSDAYSPRRPRSWIWRPARLLHIPQPTFWDWCRYFCACATDWELLRFLFEAWRGGWDTPPAVVSQPSRLLDKLVQKIY